MYVCVYACVCVCMCVCYIYIAHVQVLRGTFTSTRAAVALSSPLSGSLIARFSHRLRSSSRSRSPSASRSERGRDAGIKIDLRSPSLNQRRLTFPAADGRTGCPRVERRIGDLKKNRTRASSHSRIVTHARSHARTYVEHSTLCFLFALYIYIYIFFSLYLYIYIYIYIFIYLYFHNN